MVTRRAFMMTLIAVTLLWRVRCVAEEIPCAPTYVVQSNTSYTLTNCTLPDGVDPFVVLTSGAQGAALVANMTIDVVGGRVLPFFVVGSATQRVENISISVRGATVGPYLYRPNTTKAIFCANGLASVINLSVAVEDSVVDVTMAPTVGGILGTLVLVMPSGEMHGATVTMRNSSVALTCTGQLLCYNAALIMAEFARDSSGLSVTIASSTATVDVNATAVTYAFSITVGVVTVTTAGSTSVADIAIAALGRSSLAARVVARGGVTGSAGVFVGNSVNANGLLLSGSSGLTNIAVSLEAGTNVTVEARCSETCGPTTDGFFQSHCFCIADVLQGSTRNVSFSAVNTSFAIAAPKYAIVLRIVNVLLMDHVYINITSCSATLIAEGRDVGQTARFGVLVHSSASTINDAYLVVDMVHGVARAESGGCTGVATALVMLNGDTVSSSMLVKDSSLVAAVVNGTVLVYSPLPGFMIGTLSMATTLVNIGPAVGAAVATNVTIDIAHSTVAAEHSTSLPTGAALLFVGSLISALASTSSVVGSTIRLANVHAQRTFPASAGPASWFPPTVAGFRQNATGLVILVDIKLGAPAAYLQFLEVAANVVHTNVTTVISSNCTVGYDPRLAPASPDLVYFVVPPTLLNTSRIYVDEATLFPERGGVAFGVHIAAVGGVRMLNSTVEVHSIPPGAAALLFIDAYNLTLAESATVAFSGIVLRLVTLRAASAALLTPLMSGDGNITLLGPQVGSPLAPSALIGLTQSQFQGFDQLLNPLTIRVQQGTTTAALAFGCNLWDGAPLSPSSIGLDAALRPHVAYPRSAFNSTYVCVGFRSDTQSPSEIADIPLPEAPTQLAITITTSASTAAALVYITLLPVTSYVGRGAVPGLQRATAVLRLSARCAAQDASPASGAGSEPPMFSQLVDNPLSLPVPVGADALRYAAGAAVGDMLLVCAVAGVLHAVHRAQLRWAPPPPSRRAAVLQLLPSCPLPGAPAGTFGRLVQPAVGACVALLISNERSAASVACGVAMLVLWAAYPAYCAVVVAWRGRRGGVFVLTSRAVAQPRRQQRGTPVVARIAAAVRYATAETHEWSASHGRGSGWHRGTPEHRIAAFLLREMEAVFGAFVGGREWYFAVEWGIAALSGAVLGAAEAAAVGGDACAAVLWGGGCAVGLCCVQVLLCLLLRPHSVRMELWMVVLLGCLELLSNALLLAGLDNVADTVVTVSSSVDAFVVLIVVIHVVHSAWTLTRVVHPSAGKRHNALNVARHRAVATRDVQLQNLIAMICSSKPDFVKPHPTKPYPT